jgi:hypothetical protein
MRRHYTTTEAAYLAGVDPRSFVRWARRHHIQPVRRMRIGRSYVTLWSYADITAATHPTPTLADHASGVVKCS